MRFFIALEIPEESRKELESVQQKLKEVIPDVRLTYSDKLHLTIAFLGEQEDELKEEIIRVVKEATSDITPFTITPAFIDGFPNLHHARTFWVGVKGDTDKLVIMSERIKDGLIDLGFNPEDRRYIPHIAIGKIHDDFNIGEDQEEKLQEFMIANSFEPIQINSIKLFESIPSDGFHKHNTLAEIPLIAS